MTTDPGPACKLSAPAPELIAVLENLIPGRALDLAAGSGRHAKWLSDRGWDVTAVDTVIPGNASGKVRWIETDLEKGFMLSPVDLIICWLYWQPELLPAIAAAVIPGGVVALAGKISGRFATSLTNFRSAFPHWHELSAGDDAQKAWFIVRKEEYLNSQWQPERLVGRRFVNNMANKTEKCAHPSCNCTAVKDSKYCSTFCEGASTTPDITCSCGHAGCTPQGMR